MPRLTLPFRTLVRVATGAAAVGTGAAALSASRTPLATQVALAALLVAVVALVLAVRVLRDRAAVIGQRLDREQAARTADIQQSRSTVEALTESQQVLLDMLVDVTSAQADLQRRLTPEAQSSDGPVGVLAPQRALHLAPLLIERGDALRADEALRAAGVADQLPLRFARQIGRALRHRGYLSRAMPYFELAGRLGTDNDRTNLLRRRDEASILRDGMTGHLPTTTVDSVPGRVLHVVGKTIHDTQSGYTLRTHYTVRAARRLGVDAAVVGQIGLSSAPDGAQRIDDVTYFHPAGPTAQEVGLRDWVRRNAEAVLAVTEQFKPAVLHAHSDYLNAISAEAVSAATGIPVVYESRGFWEESWLSRVRDEFGSDVVSADIRGFGMPEMYSWRRQREAAAREGADHVVTLARVMAERIIDDGLEPTVVSVVPNAVEANTFPVEPRDAALADQLGIETDELVIGYISSIVEYEGIDTLVDAFAALRSQTQVPVRLLIVGAGPVLDSLRERALGLGLDDAIFTGKVPHAEILRYYSLIDVFVVPRRPTDVCHLVTPLKPFEAFATGRTVVLSDVRALREIAEDSDAAVTFEAGNADALAVTLLQLSSSADMRATLAQRGAAWVRRARTWDANALAYRDVYAAVLARSGKAEGPTSRRSEPLVRGARTSE